MIYKFEWVEKKRPDWIVATLAEGIENGQTFADVSINRTNKDGSLAFPKFDEFMPGGTVEGNLWRSPTTQKLSLFAPRPAPKNDGEAMSRQTPQAHASNSSYTPRGGGFAAGAMQTKAANIEVAQERKNEAIEKAQENKGNAIKVAAAMRDATLITIALMSNSDIENAGDFMASFDRVKKWYLSEWEKTEKDIEIPF